MDFFLNFYFQNFSKKSIITEKCYFTGSWPPLTVLGQFCIGSRPCRYTWNIGRMPYYDSAYLIKNQLIYEGINKKTLIKKLICMYGRNISNTIIAIGSLKPK